MKKDTEETEIMEDVDNKEVAVEAKPVTSQVALVQVATEYGFAYQTPDGVMNEKDYLVWIGNLLLEVKQGTIG